MIFVCHFRKLYGLYQKMIEGIKMEKQQVIEVKGNYKVLDDYFSMLSPKRILLVCGQSIKKLKIGTYFETLQKRMGIYVTKFDDFTPNPSYDSVVKGISIFREECCDFIVAVGGGSSIDVAKCIKLFANMVSDKNYLEHNIVPNKIPFLAVPTTAGSGSESTKYAVIYFKGEKQSITDESCIPGTVLMDASALEMLPIYYKKATMLDALCHAVESYWSVASTYESKQYSKRAIELILENWKAYLANDMKGNENILKAASIAGKAINIAQTTAGHAMSYKLTGLYGIAHGHAAALCIAKLWPYMLKHMEDCCDRREVEYLEEMFIEIANIMGCCKAEEAANFFQNLLNEMELSIPSSSEEDYAVLRNSVNLVRLKNNPIRLSEMAIEELYRQILYA